MIDGTCHMINGGMSKGAFFKCSKCGKEIYSDIFKYFNSFFIYGLENIKIHIKT